MIALATGNPSAKVEGEQIAVEIPSGKTTVTLALDLHQALALAAATRRACNAKIEEQRQRASAEIIAFPTKRVLSLAKRERELSAVIRDFPDAFTARR